jgi:Mitochondrial ribosomal protein (VAR1)
MKTEIKSQMISSASNLNISAKRKKILKKIGSILKSQSKTIKIDNRILPLFRRPLVIANREEYKNNDDKIKQISTLIIKENKLTSLSSQEKNKQISNLILGYFLDYLILKNLNLKKYLHQKNKLALIIKKKSDKLSNEISNFIEQVNLLIFKGKIYIKKKEYTKDLELKSITKKTSDTLFTKKQKKLIKMFKIICCTKKQKNYNTVRDLKIPRKNRFRKFYLYYKISAEEIIKGKEKNKELIKFGNKIIHKLDFHIYKTNNLINKIKNQNKVLNFFKNINIFSLNLNINNNNNNNNNIGFDSKLLLNYNLSPSILKLYKNLLLNKMFNLNLINKSNLIQIEHTIKSIFKNKEFNINTQGISENSNPISVVYNKKKSEPILHKYLQVMSKYKLPNKKIYIYYSNIIGFKFNSETSKLFKNIYKLLSYSFKSMYVLISKPVFVFTSNKIIIQLFYYLFIPNFYKNKKFYNKKFNKNKKKFSKKLASSSSSTIKQQNLKNPNAKPKPKLRRKHVTSLEKNKLRINLSWIKRIYKKQIRRFNSKFKQINIIKRQKLTKLYIYKKNITKIFKNKFKILCNILSNLFKKSVELNLIRIHYPYNDSNILANLLAIFINRIKLRIIAKKLFRKAVIKKKYNYRSTKTNKFNIIPSFLSGINIKMAGRLLYRRIVPKKTVKIIRRGAVSRSKINYLDVARFTNKNKRGAYSITVSSGQNLFI